MRKATVYTTVFAVFLFISQQSGFAQTTPILANPSPIPTPEFDALPQNRVQGSSTDLTLRAVHSDGTVETLNWKTKVEPFPSGSPGVRIQVSLPSPPPEFESLGGARIDEKTNTLETILLKPDANFLGKKDSFLFSLEPRTPWIKIDPTCINAGLSLHMGPEPTINPVYLMIECSPVAGNANQFKVKFSYPPRSFRFEEAEQGLGSATFAAGIRDVDTETAASAEFTLAIPDPKNQHASRSTLVAKFSLKDAKIQANRADFEIGYKGTSHRKWNFDGGLGLSFLSYDEPTLGSGLSISQLGLNGKINGHYTWIPDQVFVAANLFSTLIPVPVSRNPINTPASFFGGANLRVGYQLPEKFSVKDARIILYGGWYAWSSMGQSTYGISLLTGPQFFAVFKVPKEKGLSPSYYFKYSPISESLSSFKFSNAEIAIGGSYPVRIRPIFKDDEVYATLDIARMNAASKDNLSQFSLLSVTAGISVPFKF